MLPSDVDAEGTVLGYILLDGDKALDQVVDFLRADHFYANAHQLIYRAVLDLAEAGKAIDRTSVGQILQDRDECNRIGGYLYLQDLIRAAPAGAGRNLAQHGQTVVDLWRARETIKACREIAARGENGVERAKIDAFLDDSVKRLEEVASEGRRETASPFGACAAGALAAIQQARSEGRRLGRPSGFDRLDAYTGGLFDADLTLVAGRPGGGKSTFAGQLALNVAKAGLGCMVFSLEMSRGEWAHRILAAEAEIDAAKFRLAALSDSEIGRVERTSSDLSALPLTIDDKTRLTLIELRSKVRRAQASGKVGLVVVDYLQLMRGESTESREREIASVGRGLKEVAKDLRVPIVALSQLNRSIEHRQTGTPLLSDLRESGELEQAADNVMFLVPGANDGVINLVIAKQRNGPTGTVELRFDKRILKFSEV